LGDWQQALDYYQQALTIKNDLGDSFSQAITLNNIGAIYFQLGQWDKALNHFHKALSIRHELGDLRGASTTHELIAMTHRDAGNLVEAAKAMSLAADLAETVQSPYQDQMQKALMQIEEMLKEQETE
jgi:tetratricopeptide (TPR) repeat protein